MLRSVVATGKVEPITKVEIKSKANGIIERLLVDVDQVVQPGQVLAELDKENLTARVREARANLQAAEAAQAAAVAQLSKNEIEAESPDVEFARRSHARAMQLFEQRLVSQSALDEAQSQLQAARASQALAQARLDKTQIKAPYDGVLGLRQASVGDYLSAGQNIVNLEVLDPLKVDFRIPQKAVA